MTGPNDPTEPTPVWAPPPVVPPAPTTTGAPLAAPPPAPAHETPAAPVTAVRRPARKRGAVDVVLVVAAIFAIGGIGFAVGRVTAPATVAGAGAGQFPGNGQAGQFPGNGQGGQFQGGGQGGFLGAGGGGITLSGEVVAVTADQLTLKLASGQTIQVPLDSSTTYHSQAPATATDVTTGATVQVQVGRAGGNGGNGPNASPGTGGTGGRGLNLGAATSVTVVPK